MNVGDTVKLRDGLYADEKDAFYRLIELNGNRAVIEFICDLPIPPQSVARTAELQVVEISPVKRKP